MNLLKHACIGTNEYLNQFDKAKRKKIGQFFTPEETALFMGNLVEKSRSKMTVLDPGAGSGILSISVIDSLVKKGITKEIELTLYENNSDIIPLLISNLKYTKERLEEINIKLEYTIIEANFIETNFLSWTEMIVNDKFDIVICNPPYKKIGKHDLEASLMSNIVHGQPNIYFLFMAMGAKLLKDEGELIYIVPRSFTSGLYFTKFRKWFFQEVNIKHVHLFLSRSNVFNCDNILQETIILKAAKTKLKPKEILITKSNGIDFNHLEQLYISYQNCIVNDENSFLYIPTDIEDVHVLSFVNSWQSNLKELGYKLRTGLVVDFRNREYLREKEDEESIPLLWSYNVKNNEIIFPIEHKGKPQYLDRSMDTHKFQMSVEDYIIMKRFTSKEEKKRIQCALVLKEQFINYDYISTENHLNYISGICGQNNRLDLLGIYVVINSTYMDKYFRVLNGSTQVNANEINAFPFPTKKDIRELGKKLSITDSKCEITCDRILENYYNLNVDDRSGKKVG